LASYVEANLSIPPTTAIEVEVFDVA